MPMIDVVVIVVVVLLLGGALYGTIRHFKGKSPCCGGGKGLLDAVETKKLDGPAIGRKIVYIEGMHCDHCVQSVQNAINRIDGAVATVSLQDKKAVVNYDRAIEDAQLRAAVEEAGFRVASIES